MPVVELLHSKTAEIAALIAAALFPLGLVFLKKGYDHSTPLYGTTVVTAMNALVLWAMAFSLSPVHLVLTSAALFFVIGGFLGHGLARYFQFIGLHHVGAARNTTVVAGIVLIAAF